MGGVVVEALDGLTLEAAAGVLAGEAGAAAASEELVDP
jgi:hypothetical protein